MRAIALVVGGAVVACVGLCAGSARAEEVPTTQGGTDAPLTNPVEAARALAYQGQEAFDRGDYEEAASMADAAQRLVQAPTLALLEARALKKLGRYLEARTQYRLAAAPVPGVASEAFDRARQAAAGELLILEADLPQLAIQSRKPESSVQRAYVLVDGVHWPAASLGTWVPLDPGKHVIEVEIGATKERHLVDLEPRARQRLYVGMPQGQSDGSSLRTPLAVSSFALGLLGLGTGIGFSVHAESLRGELEVNCPGGVCPPAEDGRLSDYRTAVDLSTAGYVVGATGAVAGGIVLLALPGSGSADGAATVSLGAGRLDLRGGF